MKALLLMTLLMVCSSCTVMVSRENPPPPPPVVTAAPPSPATAQVVNTRLGLPAYPGSRLLKLEGRGNGGSEVEFETGAPLSDVYAYFHNQLEARGWARIALEAKSAATKLEAVYQRSGVRFKLELDQQGRSGRYKLEIDF